MKTGIFCRGEQCPVRNACLRHSMYHKYTQTIGGYSVIRKCTNQKMFIRDEEKDK